MNFLSLFSGIGGLDLGLERAGFRCVAQVECDPYCRCVLAKHWPGVPRFDDVRTVTRETFAGLDIDCIAGGFPCTDISNAGKCEGIRGERSGLWSEFYRLICDIRPAIVLVENVAALLVRGMATVLGDLAASGYDAEWDCLPACEFGADHERERTFIVAHPAGVGQPKPRFFRPDPRGYAARGGWETTDALDAIRRGTVPALCRGAHGVPDRVDRLRGLGNAVVPAVAEWIGRRILAAAAESEAVR